jgi:RHS repeat-associated protein
LLSGVTYFPFGSVSGWIWGNSSTVSRTYNTDGNVSQISTAGDVLTFGYDNALRISSLSDTLFSTNGYTAGYDALDRLNSLAQTGVTSHWTFDADGNHLTQTGTSTVTTTPSTTSNRLNSISGSLVRTYAYDAAGDTLSYTGASFGFNERGRMSSATVGSTGASYIYNALGQLIEKTVGGVTTLLMYDEAGHLLGEYSSTGALIQETVWMDDTPVATLRPNGSTVNIYYVHTDHLNAPRVVTQSSDNLPRWLWGGNAANQNPLGLGTFVYNLRYPGQYFQAETGLSYNYFRDYDGVTGRYIESDPIGLAGGINTYAYVGGNPISLSDPLGLCADRQRCAQLRQNINNKSQALAKELAKYNPALDALGGFPMRYGSGLTKPGGHYTEIQNLQRGLAKDINKYEELNCDEDDDQGPGFGAIAHSTLDMATQYVQPPQLPQISAPSVSNQTLLDAVLSALLAAGAYVALSPQ